MTKTKASSPARAAKQLIPINRLITVPEGIPIPFDHLEIADLADLSRGVTLVTFIGPSIKALITKDEVLRVRLVYKIDADDPLAQKYGVEAVVRAMSYTTKIVPVDQRAKQLPSSTGGSWKLPDEVIREFELPTTMTGAQVLAAIRMSDEFIVRTTEALLAQEAKPPEQAAQS